MDNNTQGLIQTITIMGAVLGLLVKEVTAAYKKRKKDGFESEEMRCHLADVAKVRQMQEDLHRWHAPIIDPKTGQPRFPWYEDSDGLRSDLNALRESVNRLTAMIDDKV